MPYVGKLNFFEREDTILQKRKVFINAFTPPWDEREDGKMKYILSHEYGKQWFEKRNCICNFKYGHFVDINDDKRYFKRRYVQNVKRVKPTISNEMSKLASKK